MFKYALIIIAVLVATNAASGFMLKRAWQDVATERANVVKAENAVQQQRETLAEVQRLYAEERAKVAALDGENQAIVADRDRAVADLNGFRGRLLKAAEGRPALVGRLATRATKRVMCDVFGITGGTGEPCGD